MRFVFFGTDQFSTTVLDALKVREILPTLIVTVPDKPQGRKLVLTPPLAKVWAEKNNIPVLQPEKLKDFVLPELDLAIVASYGKILPASLLTQPQHGFINVHPSLLPKYRGATPLESAILTGDKETGVTIIQLDTEMDHGAILAQEKIKLEDPWLEELRDETAKLGGEMLIKLLPDFVTGKIKPQEQNHSLATYTKKTAKEDGLIKLTDNAELNYRKIRACTPWPGAYFFVTKNGKQIRVIIKRAHLNESGELIIERVTPEGRKEMNYSTYLATRR